MKKEFEVTITVEMTGTVIAETSEEACELGVEQCHDFDTWEPVSWEANEK